MRLVSRYFDTADGRLARAGIALRLRFDGRRWWQAVKGPPLAGAGGALHARSEYEWPLAAGRLDPSLFDETPWSRLFRRVLARRDLAPRFTTDFERRTLRLDWSDGSRAELAVDLGEIRAPIAAAGARRKSVRRAPIAEIEIELKVGAAAHLHDLGEALATDLPLSAGAVNKAERGHALAAGLPDGWHQPVKARSAALGRKTPTACALASIAAECLNQIAANRNGLLADDDPEWVHQMRVGTRRLRSCLAMAREMIPASTLAPVETELRWLADALGDARDWDVFVTEILSAASDQFTQHATSAADRARMRSRCLAQRRAARASARAAVASPRYTRLLLAVGKLCAATLFEPPSAGPAAIPVETFARSLLRRRHRRLARAAKLALHGDAAQRHALRIAAKKQRYAAEFFGSAVDGEEAATYAAALAAVQDVLGRANDAATALRLISTVTPPGDSPAAAALRAAATSIADAIGPELAPAWKNFTQAPRFWRNH